MIQDKQTGALYSSYSQLSKYLTCPYQYKLHYIDEIRPDIKSKHLEYGLVIHETMEHFFTNLAQGKQVDIDELCEVYDMLFMLRDVDSLFDSEEERAEFYNEGLAAIDNLYAPQNKLEELIVSPDVEILGVEEDFTLNLFGVDIIGFIDLILRTDKGIIAIDHKSGGKLYPIDKLQTDLQFPIYAMAIKERYAEWPTTCYYNFTRLHQYQEVDITEQRIEEAKAQIKEIFDAIAEGKFPPKPSPLCWWCDFGKNGINICKRASKWQPRKR